MLQALSKNNEPMILRIPKSARRADTQIIQEGRAIKSESGVKGKRFEK